MPAAPVAQWRRNAIRQQAAPRAERRVVTGEDVGWWTTLSAVGYATFQEHLSIWPKTVGGTVLAGSTALALFLSRREKRKRERDADR